MLVVEQHVHGHGEVTGRTVVDRSQYPHGFGDVAPKHAGLPATCDLSRVVTFQP